MPADGFAAINGEDRALHDDHILSASSSPAVQALDRIIAEIAPTEIPVLLVGDSGTGKEIMARRIHQLSSHSSDPFTKIISGDLTTELLETFFSPNRGGGPSMGIGVGTIFFDEVSEMDPLLQAKLLHMLPDGDSPCHRSKLTARTLAGTSHKLEEKIRTGKFRDDLYYRLNAVCLRLPTLSARKEDIPALVRLFASKYAAEIGQGRAVPSIGANTMRALVEYSWPGNIRQLKNTIRRMVVLGDEELALADLRSSPKQHKSHQRFEAGLSLKEAARAASRQAERGLILEALGRTRWNRKRAARELRISYKALLYKLKQFDLDHAAKPDASGGDK
jgi:two-component system, NtrC family, response regulator AtoC